MFLFCLLVCAVCITLNKSNQLQNPEVDTPLGKILGKTVFFCNTPVKTFQGIPFAKPPVGDLRFRKPSPVESWKEPLLAKSLPPGCIQHSSNPFPWLDNLPNKTIDCLYLNIWAPIHTTIDSKKAVMFWMHGGGFRIGSSRLDFYDGRVLAALGDVIVVTTNYRLAVEGFLHFGTEEAPGNMALYDVLEALKWVKSNIRFFGGNENSITFFGQSSGAITAGMFMVSPLARGLFARAILQSGSPTNLDAEDNDRDLKLSQEVAKAVGCASKHSSKNNPDEVVRCLRGKDALELAKTLGKINDNPQRGFYPKFGDEILPVNARQAFILGNFGNFDILIGSNHNEGSILITKAMKNVFGFFGEKNPAINKTFGKHVIKKNFKDFPDTIVDYYLGNVDEDARDIVLYQVQTASGDYARVCPSVYLAESVAKKGNRVYFYYFVHRPSPTPWAPWMGVAHFDETPFAFGYPLRYPKNYTNAELLLSERMINVWTNFAKSGAPPLCESWPLYSKEHYFLRFKTDGESTGIGPHLNNCDFFRPYFGF
ncbi:acetylcholinesterase-1 [Nephila pilipes]|uniref:acetylcholinesterase n=1 Tax=Nephila pilipes TaxID=299642 RepID=A0A8X6UN41_NEPPI|nr:acetylcholinesterase-1 [Nephila pilipes]